VFVLNLANNIRNRRAGEGRYPVSSLRSNTLTVNYKKHYCS